MASIWQRYPRLKWWLPLGAVAGIGLCAVGQHYFAWFGIAAMAAANLLFFCAVGWLFWRLLGEELAVSREIKAAMMEFQLSSDATVEAGNGGYPCTELLQRYRGLVDGREVCLLKVMLGSGRRAGFGWFAATPIVPPFQQKFRLTASRYPPPQTRFHPRLTEFAVAVCDCPGWVGSWIDSLPAPALAALNAQLVREPAVTVTEREVYRRADEITAGGAAPVGPAFRELIALAQLLAKSVEETK